jgi:hypothetical protein
MVLVAAWALAGEPGTTTAASPSVLPLLLLLCVPRLSLGVTPMALAAESQHQPGEAFV